ncbi:molecular chaperone GrpE [Spiractinospora alimapuensis]|uniref:molecular chaperone GrpE n=1 Tax=Spiractinospora alimapuensis TaxID=2820884 RepID=UPI001F3BDD55|nr:molecular chaperone GrpE [Spiractinospora alimapuensis]QVQ52807.1 molecular chaperone GrpE [Spiractinospora alimapuensis]
MTRRTTPRKKRFPVSVERETERFAEAAHLPGTAERAALVEISGTPAEGTLTLSATLAALVEAGHRATAHQVLADAYTAMAAERTEEDHAARAAMRGRVSRGEAA